LRAVDGPAAYLSTIIVPSTRTAIGGRL
jgi:hypothetical protein